MAGRTDGLIKNFRAGAALAAYSIVKFGAADTDVLPAAAAGDGSIGVTGELAATQGERTDIHMSDIADVRLGGPVTRGDPLTADAQARAIVAPGVGAVRIIGFAMASGGLGDVAPVRLAPGVLRG